MKALALGVKERCLAAPAVAGGGHTDFGKRCFWAVLPAGVWSRATTEWIETLGAGLTTLNGNPNHVDYGATGLTEELDPL